MSKKVLKIKKVKVEKVDSSTSFGKIFKKMDKALGKGKVKKANKILSSIKDQEGFFKWFRGLAK